MDGHVASMLAPVGEDIESWNWVDLDNHPGVQVVLLEVAAGKFAILTRVKPTVH